MDYLVLIAIMFPILLGFLLPFLKISENDSKKRNVYSMFVVVSTSLMVMALIFTDMSQPINLISINKGFEIAFYIDGLGKIFLVLISVLWPIATLYAFEYMEHLSKKNQFFAFYVATYGVVVGLASSANLITFYLMYEILTFITLPLVMHSMENRDVKAGRQYLVYSITGASLAFIGMMIIYQFGASLDFVYGGVAFNSFEANESIILLGYLLCFFGFGVKAAVFPFHKWLPTAGVAPTPVTALLHAVAVVKSGVFAIARVTFYCFGPSILMGTYAQSIAMAFAIFTIVFGSACAYKEVHLKRRLAFSTVSNLSYILFGITLMTPLGLAAAMAHMLFHGVIKICLFFCVGAVMEVTHKEYLQDIEGYGKKMRVTFISFTIGSFALTGIPLFAGFISKYALASAAIGVNSSLALLGVLALLISAILTAYYTFEVSIKAFFPRRSLSPSSLEVAHDPSWMMKVPFVILCAMMFFLGINSSFVMDALTAITNGLV